MQSQSSHRTSDSISNQTNNRTSENGLPHATKLPLGRKRRSNQRFHECNCMEFKENFLQFIFSRFFPQNVILPRRLKLFFKERLITFFKTSHHNSALA